MRVIIECYGVDWVVKYRKEKFFISIRLEGIEKKGYDVLVNQEGVKTGKYFYYNSPNPPKKSDILFYVKAFLA